MKKKIYIFFIALILTSCQIKRQDVVGEYKSVEYNYFHKILLWLNNTSYTIGSELTIKNDSTFKYITCGNITTGYWNILEDSLVLNFQTNRWRNDSIHINGWYGEWPTVSEQPLKFHIRKNLLTTKWSINDSNRKCKTTLHQLKR